MFGSALAALLLTIVSTHVVEIPYLTELTGVFFAFVLGILISNWWVRS